MPAISQTINLNHYIVHFLNAYMNILVELLFSLWAGHVHQKLDTSCQLNGEGEYGLCIYIYVTSNGTDSVRSNHSPPKNKGLLFCNHC